MLIVRTLRFGSTMILVKMLLTVMQAVKEGKVDRNE